MASNTLSPLAGLQDRPRPSSLYSTAYTGSGGDIVDDQTMIPSVELDRNGYEDIQLSAAAKPNPTRPSVGTRWLSSFSNAQPAVAALKRSSTVLHSRAKSFAASVPKLNTATEESQQYQAKPNRIFGDLFNGESAPVQLGVPSSPTKEDECEFVMEYQSGFTERPRAPRRTSTIQSTGAQSNTGKMSWFGRKPSTPQTSPQPSTANDEFLTMNINNALFPHGPADPLSPHAFNDLLLNATSLLQRMQAAYKQKTDYTASIQPEIDAQKEEVEEAETRSQHLKMQLEDMSRRATEQQEAMKEMAQELTDERIRRQELQDAAARSVRPVRHSSGSSSFDGASDDTPRRRKRTSGGSASDSGFESDFDPETASVVSGAAPSPRPSHSIGQHMYALQPGKLRGGSDASANGSGASRRISSGGKRMGSESAAWATVDLLRNENHDLKEQMDEMQRTLQACIEFVSGGVQV